jgi:hypothetical protein
MLLNDYVHKMASYAPRDGDETILDQEDGSLSPHIPSFDWTKLEKGKSYYFVRCH